MMIVIMTCARPSPAAARAWLRRGRFEDCAEHAFLPMLGGTMTKATASCHTRLTRLLLASELPALRGNVVALD